MRRSARRFPGYQFSADNFNSMTSVLRGIGEQGDKSIVTVSSGKQDTDIFGNPVENTGDYARCSHRGE